ncbi:hypothetical protein B0H67DRAFT_650496 [Lasiosphaeris hirsuta]|uniref:Carrier domain-containing protein n=1 Tax=Lasiosphaeris hirsuta TaxID=260670 RepID=A0AA39ZPM1_9PEZI|nr:hypothetical protein B0H67DRAFT_650496 [Lasiosphaeris hirsuta]
MRLGMPKVVSPAPATVVVDATTDLTELGQTEQVIRKLCAEVLSRPVDKVKLTRSFLAQGGDSLLAIKLMARCRNVGYTINIQDLLQAASIGEFCQSAKSKATESRTLSASASVVDGINDSALSNGRTKVPDSLSTAAQSAPQDALPRVEMDISAMTQLTSITPNPLRDIEYVFPCSSTQEIFLAAQAVRPEMYQITAMLEFQPTTPDGHLDFGRLCDAWERLVQRHPSLRTVFIDSKSRPGHFDQVVMKRGLATLRFLDQKESTAAEFSARRPVSFPNCQATHGAAIYKNSEASAYFRLDVSHALVDGESFYVILQDLCRAYDEVPSAAPMEYQNFVSYQQQLSTQGAISYWSNYLSGAEASFFPVPGNDVDHRDLDTVRFHIETAHELFCGKLNVTVANVCQVAWALVLRAYTASEDVCFSYASSGRHAPLPGIEGAVGAFAETMIFRLRTAGATAIAEALAQAKRDFAQGFAYPAALILGDGQAARDFARLRGNTMVSCQRAWVDELAPVPTGLVVEVVDVVNPSEYDLSVNIQVSNDALHVTIDFWRSRINQEMVASVARSFQKAVTSILTSDATLLAALDVVPSDHIERIREWRGEMPPRVEARIQDRVYEQRLLRPDALAIQGWDGDFTYKELDDEANKLASHLVGLGLGPEIKVPLCFDKSKWAVVSQLAVLKAGGCVVPIGVKQPAQRTEIILKDIGATIVLADAKNATRFASIVSHVLVVDDSFMIQLPNSGAIPCPAVADNCAFVIYTSGSTGIPKGVVLPHASLCTSLRHLADKFRLGTATRMLQFSAYTFDISIQDIYTTLQTGGCLCVISEEDRVVNLGAAMRLYAVNCAGLTSTVAGLVSPNEVPSLRTLVLLGEAVKPAVVDKWIPSAHVFNAYGPSECSIQSSVNELTPECDALNIGYALAGALWIVDANDCNRLVPVGAPGELLIEGPLLARGYLNDAKKTSAAFISSPAWVFKYGFDGTRRLYRTGDLVRQNPDGSVTYIGRRDTQVKVRGQRVEFGEIEHHLIQHEHALDAAVVFPHRGPCKDRLVGLVTLGGFLTSGGAKSDVTPVSADKLSVAKLQANEFSDYLSARVPEHMIPKVWIPLASMMPQNDSGKLDRKRLGIWAEEMDNHLYEAIAAFQHHTGPAEAGTPLELQIQGIWAKVLKVPTHQIPIKNRSFLGCGGDSIAAMQVVSQCRAQGISIGVRGVLQSKSITELAAGADGVQTAVHETVPVAVAGLGSKELKMLDKVLPGLGLHLDDVEDIYPCSPIQQGILVSQAKSPSAYLIQQSFEVRPSSSSAVSVSAEGILKAWQTLVDRHSTLRTIFLPAASDSEHGLFNQLVLRSYRGGVKHVHCDDNKMESELAVKTDISIGGAGEPSHQLTVYSTTSGRVYARLMISHALVDASSLSLLQRELTQAYDGLLTTEGPAPPHYRTYVSYLQQTPALEAVGFWSTRLAGAEPCYLPALTESGFPGATAEIAAERQPQGMVTQELENARHIQEFGKTHGVTVATVFQLAWALVLSQYTGSQDVSFGYLTSGRDAPIDRVNDLVGPLINIMAARIQLRPEMSTRQGLVQVQTDFLDGFDHQHAALVDIWHSLRLEGQSLFNTSLSYRHAPPQGADGASVTMDIVTVEDPTEYDANVNVFASDRNITVMLQHSPTYISADGASRALACLLQAVQWIIRNIDSPLRDARIVADRDVARLCEWNSPSPGEAGERDCIHDLVRRQRLVRPEAKAVCAWDGDMTYGELEDAADQLAHHLAADLAVGPEVTVALCLDKSRWAVVAQLAVLKAGGVVVSVNPKHPTQRLHGILTDIRAPVMLTTRRYAPRFGDVIPHVVPVDQDLLSQLPPAPSNPVWESVKSENAAFIIYTSGSTGVPKGVVLTHSSLCASFQAHGEAYGMNSSTRALQFAAYTFDASISDIWATITRGGCVCVISEDERMNNLQGAINTYAANLAQLTPTVAGLLDVPKLTTLRTLVLGGEAVKAALVEGFLADGRVGVINGYGPSECSVYTTCNGPLGPTTQPSNIGRVLVGGVWVINSTYGAVCPIGGIGELWIGGPLLGRGYLNDKAKTDASFVTNPSWAAANPETYGRRFYRTGDLVRQNAVGEIIYIGRKDTQVKIRGQRVEMGEIEHKTKKALPEAFKMVAVSLIMPGGKPGNPALAVSVEAHGEHAPNSRSPEGLLPMSDELRVTFSSLHASLSEALPSYMVPRLFVPFSRLPCTSSGKLDRRALCQVLQGLPEHSLTQYGLFGAAGKAFPPTTTTEKTLQTIWANVLGVELGQVGVKDHFLRSGGDSFTAMRLVSRADAAGLALTVADVFRCPKLADMASFIDQKGKTMLRSGEGKNREERGEGEAEAREDGQDDRGPPQFALWQELERFQGEGGGNASSTLDERLHRIAERCGIPVEAIEDVYPCTPLQEGLMAITAQQPRAYVNRWVYRIPPTMNCARFQEAWVAVARAAPLLRTRIVPGELSRALQVVVRDDITWFSGPDLDQYLADSIKDLMTYGSPLVRLAILGVAKGQQYFAFTAHHGVYDGWSWARLFDAAAHLYHGQYSIPPSPPFNRFISYLTKCSIVAAESFWRSQLGGKVPDPFPPQPKSSPQPNPTQTMTREFTIPPRPSHITMAAFLRAAWALVISSQSGADVVFGTVLTGRTAPVRGIFDMLAPTITTVPVRMCIDKTEPVVDYLAAVQQQMVSMIPFEHTGLQNIHRLIGVRLDIGHLFTVQPAEVRSSLMTAPLLGLELYSAPSTGADDYGLSVECITGLGGDSSAMQVSVRFDEAIVSSALLGRLLGRFQHTLTQLAQILEKNGENGGREGDVLVGDLSIVSPEEVAQLVRWNAQIPNKKQTLVHELVREAGLTRPDAPAICSWDGDLGHGELDALADKLAHKLVGLGVGPEVAVPVCFGKSKWAVVSILAVLKASGVVVPVAAEPAQRRHISRFPGIGHILAVDDDLLRSLPNPPQRRVESRASPSNAAFIIYTSGSTGTPKGVVLEHASMSTGMQAHGARFGMDPETRAFQFASFTFDISLHDMITTLQFGGCVCMPSEEERLGDVAGAMRKMDVNYTFLPPRVLPTLNPSDVPGLRTLVVGGEATQAEHIEPWLGRMRVFNAYGPAECCIVSTCNELTDVAETPNIGRAVAGGLWVVDEQDFHRLLPIGSVGELLIEGPLLARGYLNNPEKSSAAFISNPGWLAQYGFADASGTSSGARRFYRTGDLVRQNGDGSLTYVGRRDSQVKIRGQRVEIGEIEHHLKRHESVGDAVVLYPTRGPAESRLVALLTFSKLKASGPAIQELQPTAPDQAQLANSLVSRVHEQLVEHVPSYMIPSTWISLRSLPQNSSNKIDRRRLMQWLEGMSTDDLESIAVGRKVDAPEAPENDLQRKLHAVVAEVLRLPAEKVAMNRSFLSMGGDSISAMRVVSQSRNQHAISITVRDVLQSASIARLALKAKADTADGNLQDARIQTRSFSLKKILRQLAASPPHINPGDLVGMNLTYEGLSRIRADLTTQAGITDLDEVEDVYPCSPIQQGIATSQIKGHATYNVQQICELQTSEAASRVDLGRLSQAWEAVVRRHSILRTTFVQTSTSQDHLFYQVVLKRWRPQIRTVQHHGIGDVAVLLSREEPATYRDGQPPHRLTLCVAKSGATYAKLEASHALVDAASLSLILRDVVSAYHGSLPESPAPSYGTYVHFLQQTPEAESLTYWTDRLAGVQPCYLPPSTTPTTKTRSLATVAARVESPAALHGFRDAHGVTMANMMQLAWAVVLARYTGSRDITFGYLTNGRDAPVPGANDIVGPMINMMVSRIRLGELPATVAHAAQQVQDDFLKAFAHQRTSLSSIQHVIRLSERSLFNTTMSYFRRSPEHAPSSSGLTIRSISGEDPTEYDAGLSILAGEDSIHLSLQYSTSFMDQESARLVLESFRHALLTIASSAEARLDELDALAPSDVEKLRLWNSDVRHAAPRDCVHHGIRQQCLSQPDAQAVCAWDGTMRYAEMDALSDQLASHLEGLGVREEVMVGLCFEKSMWTIVAMLAVVKAGGVVVPLGLHLPTQRLRLILDDAEAPIVLTSEQCMAKLDDIEVTHKLAVNAALFATLRGGAGPPARPGPTPENAAVVIYTSGSTGLPKGVVLTHGGLCASLDAHGARLGLGVGARALQYSAYVFDLSLLDIFGTLRFGGCVCVASEADRMHPSRLATAMEAMKVNFSVLTPTVASIVDPARVPSLRTLVLAGEAVQPAVVETWSGRVILFNGYGPAECTVLAAINGPLTDKDQSRNVGSPLVATLWVTDQDGHSLVPIGAVGELLIEGPLLSRGYLHDPERTAAAFITDPAFISRYGFVRPDRQVQRRMYRTGDLVRQSPLDGSITYVGRRDGQVKIRGQRLEVGEIEYWTKRAFHQAQAVAVDLAMPRVRSGEPILAAILELPAQGTHGSQRKAVLDGPLPLPLTDSLRYSLSTLQDALTQALPSYMVPTLYVPVQRMPLTASGKLDRGQLKTLLNSLAEDQLASYALVDEASPTRSLTDMESRLRDLWISVLGTTRNVGPASHFFRLGGDSVTAMRLVAMAGDDTKPAIRLGVADIFQNPVLKNMANTVASRLRLVDGKDPAGPAEMDAAPFSLMPISWNTHDNLVRLATQCRAAPDAIEDAYPCTPLQEALLALTAQERAAYVGRWVFQMDEGIDADRLRSAWQKVSEVAPILRTRILAGDGSQAGTQVVVRDPVPWRTVSSDLEAYLSQDGEEPMDFGTELTRLAVVITPSSTRFFVWTAHHSIYDGWTTRKLLEAVRDVCSGRPAPTFVPYTRFIRYLQRANASSDAKGYWRAQLKGVLSSVFPAMPSPNHQPRPSSTINLRVTTAAAAVAGASSTITTATLLRAAWALVLSQETGSRDVLFAAPLSGRTSPVPGILDIAAPTLATVPVRISIDRGGSVADYLGAVQRQAAEMIPFEHVGLQRINQMLADDKALGIGHLFVVQPFADRLGQDASSLLPPGLEPVRSSAVSAFHRYPLVVECNTGPGPDESVELEACFDPVAISSEKVRTILERLGHVFVQLRAVASSTGHPNGDGRLLARIDTLGPQDAARIRAWNKWDRAAAPRSSACVHELVHRQQLVQPGSQAVCAWDGKLTYAELDDLSHRLARHLVSLGVAPEVPVPMILEKSLWAVVAQLAVLRAGGVVVPIGHKHPIQRVQDITRATGAEVVLVSKHWDKRDGLLVSHVLVVDEHLLRGLPSTAEHGPACDASPANAAFIIFTSGSTGVPKGVVLEHGALATSLAAEGDLFAGPNVRALQFSSYTFDVSIAETFVPLITGGCVCVASEDDRVSNLAAAMEAMGVNLAYLTPTVAGLLQPQQVPSLETLVLIGEALRSEAAARWMGGRVRVFNAYGPAECSILSTSSRQITDASEAPSIGTAIAGSNLWVVDPSDYHHLVPVGIPGELLIEGPLLARGYLGDDKKTADAFVTDPAWLECFDFGPVQGRRFYRTGDLVQQAPDGSITYLGRRDTQAKLHGQRLEIGEIEHWAGKILGVQAGAAVVGLLAPDEEASAPVAEPVLAIAVEVDMEIWGGLGPRPAREQGAQTPLSLLPLSEDLRRMFGQLRSSLLETLPSYMVPRLYIPVGKLPTTDSGKLDRRVIWATIQRSRLSSHCYSLATDRPREAPRTDTERQLQQLWAAVLRIPPQEIGSGDDFFLSGGDSISAMRLVAKAREAGQLPLTVADIFRHPILSDLAAAIPETRSADSILPRASYQPFSTLGLALADPDQFIAQSIEPLLVERCVVTDAAPVTDFQALSVTSALRASRDLLAHVTLDREGPCDLEKWRASCWQLVRQHGILRTAYVFAREQLLQVALQKWQPDIAHFETDDDDITMDEFTNRLVAQDMNRPPCFGRPFVEFAIITSPSRHRILFRLSHAEYDAISMSYFLDDLRAIYAGGATSAEPSNFIHYISALSATPETSKEESVRYWRSLLEGSSMPRIAPRDQRAPSKLIHHATRTTSLPSQFGSRPGGSTTTTTAATLIRAAWGLTIARYTGMTDVVFGEVVSGRNTGHPVAARAAGCCANIVPVRTVLGGDVPVRHFLDAIQDQYITRLQHETVGFRSILAECFGAEVAGGGGGGGGSTATFFTTRVNHLDRAPRWTLDIGGATYRASISLPDGAQDPSDIAITSVSHAPNHIEVAFGYREGAVSAEVADRLLSCLCAAIELLAAESSGGMLLDSLLGEDGDKWLGVGGRSLAADVDQNHE